MYRTTFKLKKVHQLLAKELQLQKIKREEIEEKDEEFNFNFTLKN